VPEVPDLRHGVGDAEAAGTLALREVRGPEDPVDDRQTEVLVPRLGIDRVVAVTPVVADEDEHRRQRDRRRRGDVSDDVQVAQPEDGDERGDDERDPQRRREQVVHEQVREVGEQAAYVSPV
jgi:hypothetical protein